LARTALWPQWPGDLGQQFTIGANMAILQGATKTWTKSSYSSPNSACVEVKSPTTSALAVRDSKAPEGPTLAFPAAAWSVFVTSVKQ
jgi:hypothetical protein